MKTEMRAGAWRSEVTKYAKIAEKPLTVPKRKATIVANDACCSRGGGRQRAAATQLASRTKISAKNPTSPIVPRV